ncbi:phosphoadenosine phosphosulfate reductase [Pyrolobus fumarii 1A]|uniref:Phosphoadenosine phosphosulfate reductase n=1 Tax=Pyrolobus fumarii (strain DSM 11204 / 1A) TaxID=694429 RepID=G0EDR9_PYRF1|nr:phosphoadenosine phosphosulfate reductase [Pyrolobus fumarii 1A]
MAGPRRKLVKEIWWSIEDNTLLFSKPIGEKAYHYRFDSDVWLPGRYERRVFANLIRDMYGVEYSDNRLLLFNRVSLGEFAVAVYGEGLRLGVLEYRGRSWVLHATGALASILVSIGAETVRVETRRRLKSKKIRLDSDREHVIVESGSHVGPAVRVGPGIYKVRDMAPKGFRLLSDTGIEKLVERNEAYLKSLEREAVGFAQRLDPGPNKKVYVAFSGGADSTATLAIAVEAFGADRVTAVYVDTGIEFPDTLHYAEKIASELGVDFVVVESGGVFWRELPREGPPSRDRRWCTAKLKIEALKRFYEHVRPRLILEGVRGFESQARMMLGSVTSSPVAPTARRAFPIYEWSRLEVQLYLAWKGLPTNPLYDKGLTRIGCVVCPAMHLFELWDVSRRLYPYLVESILERFAVLVGREIVTSGDWRFLGGPAEKWR